MAFYILDVILLYIFIKRASKSLCMMIFLYKSVSSLLLLLLLSHFSRVRLCVTP